MMKDTDSILKRLQAGNDTYRHTRQNPARFSDDIRREAAANGQHPYATVIACADSRMPIEHIFSAGIGELFVIRTAGNVVDDIVLGSVEYGAEYLHTPLILVLGHTCCGAVAAALEGNVHGHVADIVEKIQAAIGGERNARTAECLNVRNTIARIEEDAVIAGLIADGKVTVHGAVYDIESGEIRFLEMESLEKCSEAGSPLQCPPK